jgi:hypothetical protein
MLAFLLFSIRIALRGDSFFSFFISRHLFGSFLLIYRSLLWSAATAGRNMLNVVPLPTLDLTLSRPPCSETIP